MRTLRIFVLSLLLWGSPANLWAVEYAGFSTDSARLLITKIKGLTLEVDYQKKEVEILKKKSVELSLSSKDMAKLNLNYKGMIADLEGQAELFEGEMILCEGRAGQWKGEAVECGKDLADCRATPWYLSKSFWVPLSFVAGMYTGASAK